uniref:Vesicle transport protein n=2 Tax=Xenopus laevis TaxID=8355 RepID=Q05AV7_XENLA|nr:SFT2 domain containing 3 S homeolog [Xenopus laevis]AAI23298.1 Unknown (protein for MGC:154607) [Xenopus laevis]
MAELGRQLQEYVAQSKSGKSVSVPVTAANNPVGERAEPAWKAWIGHHVPTLSALEPDPLLPGLSSSQRLIGAGLCVAVAALCFGLSGIYVPILLLRARKFALLWSLGSVLGLAAAALLKGPTRLLREPEPWSMMYVAALGGTLYAALGMRSTGLTVLGAAAQIITAAGLLLGLIPGGAVGRRYIGSLCGSFLRKGVAKALPV